MVFLRTGFQQDGTVGCTCRYNSLQDTRFRSCATDFIGRISRPFLTRAVSRDWQLSLGPKAHGLKLTSTRSIYPQAGKKGGQGKSPLLLDVRPPPPTVTYCTAYKAFPSGECNSRLFFLSFSLFYHRRDYSNRCSRLSSRIN